VGFPKPTFFHPPIIIDFNQTTFRGKTIFSISIFHWALCIHPAADPTELVDLRKSTLPA
jgi:hypothetical protein